MRFFQPLVVLMLLGIAACTSHLKYPYAIKDFNPQLQPYLTSIVTHGYVMRDTNYYYLKAHATPEELNKLTLSEHPLIRATALRVLCDRDTVDNFNIVMKHLDDTAIVYVDRGEWGYEPYMVTGDMLDNAVWKTQAEKDITVDSILLYHNSLDAAYFVLNEPATPAKYYISARQMALYDRPNEQLKEAATYIGRFRKKEDVPIIKNIFAGNISGLYQEDFRFLAAYPDTSYLDIFDTYSHRAFYAAIREKRDMEYPEAFISSLATYKCAKSAEILARILHRKPSNLGYWDSVYVSRFLVNAISSNECPAYASLIKEIKPLIPKPEKHAAPEPLDYANDSTFKPKIRW